MPAVARPDSRMSAGQARRRCRTERPGPGGGRPGGRAYRRHRAVVDGAPRGRARPRGGSAMMPGEPQGNQLPDLDVESLLAVLDEISEPRVREAALNLLEAVLGLHRVGFGRILNVVKSHPAGAVILQRLREDPVVESLQDDG